jgi:predicted metal-dependent phosphoesterase TrpH
MKEYPTLAEITGLIKKAGGKSFLAHLHGYITDDPVKFLDSLVSLHLLDGIECYHSLHDPDQTKYLLEYCSSHGLFASGGSDYHGALKPDVLVGETVDKTQIPFEILNPWLHLISPAWKSV